MRETIPTKVIRFLRSAVPSVLAALAVAAVPHPAAFAALPDTLQKGLVLHYDFGGEPAEGTIVDASGNGNNGQATGVKWVAHGRNGAGCAQFGLNDAFITVPNNASLNPAQFTLAAWIKTDYTDSIWRRIFDKGYNKEYALSIAGDWPAGDAWQRGQFVLELAAGGGTISGVRVTDGNWHHVAATFDGSVSRLFADGRPVGGEGRGRGHPGDPSFNLTIGENRSNPNASLGEVGAAFNGLMSDVMMYNRALSATEVQHLFVAQGGALAAPPPLGEVVPPGPELKYGLYIHYGLPTFAHPGERGELPAARFAPANPDPGAWARLAKQAGMTFAILTVKHESGFCLWRTADYDYDLGHSPYQGDLLGDFITACNAEGILPGVHYSIPDTHNEGTLRNDGPVPKLYFDLIKKQVAELHTKYPGLRVQIFDASQRLTPAQWDELRQIVQRVNPHCAVIDSQEPGVVHYNPASINQGWMWRAGQRLSAAAGLYEIYRKAQSASRGCILNVGPDPDGKVPDEQTAVLMQVKEMIAHPEAAPAPAAAPQPDAATRLKKLQSLYDQGLISKDDYEKKKKEIMDAL